MATEIVLYWKAQYYYVKVSLFGVLEDSVRKSVETSTLL